MKSFLFVILLLILLLFVFVFASRSQAPGATRPNRPTGSTWFRKPKWAKGFRKKTKDKEDRGVAATSKPKLLSPQGWQPKHLSLTTCWLPPSGGHSHQAPCPFQLRVPGFQGSMVSGFHALAPPSDLPPLRGSDLAVGLVVLGLYTNHVNISKCNHVSGFQGSKVPRFQGSKVGNPNSCQGDSLLLCSGAGGFVAVHQSCCNQQVCAKIINKYVQVLAINHNQSNHVLISSQGWEPQLLHLPPALSPQGDDLQCSGAWCHGWLHTNHVHAILLAMCQSHHQKVAHTQ